MPAHQADSASQPKSISVIGTDDLGISIAYRLMKWPGGLTVYDVNGRGYSTMARDGIAIAATLTDALEADIVSIVDIAASGVDDLFDDLGRRLKAGTILAVHSTISESTLTQAANDLIRGDVHLVDAPVSGSPTAALIGELAVMVGATPEVFSNVEAPFSQWASLVVLAGATGMGLRMKLAESLLTFTTLAAAQEAQRLATAGGVDRGALCELIQRDGFPEALAGADANARAARSFDSDADESLSIGADESIEMPLTEQAKRSIGGDAKSKGESPTGIRESDQSGSEGD